MPTTLFLVRHAAHALLGKILVGRMAGVSLSAEGEVQARRLGQHLAHEPLSAVQSSPRERARETAAAIAQAAGRSFEEVAAIDEINVGEWTGRAFSDLANDPRWQQWNEARNLARAPGGETMRDVQLRMADHFDTVRASYPEGRVVIVSHSDPIRAALLYYLGISLHRFDCMEIVPAGVSRLRLDASSCQLLSLNEVAA